MNSFLLALTVLLIVALSALFAVPYLVDFNAYRDVFEAQATKVMGRDVTVRGPVELSLLPVPELRFDQVTVASEGGGTALPFMEAETLQASLNIGALLRGTVEAQQLTIVDPVLRLKVEADGTAAWSDVGLSEAPLPFAPKRVAFDSVTVTGGRIEIYAQEEPVATIEEIEGEATAASLAGPYKVAATYRIDDDQQEIQFSTGSASRSGEFRLRARIGELDSGTTLLLDGQVGGMRASPYYDGDITARILPYRAPLPSETAVFEGVPVATLQEGEPPAEGPATPAMSLVELKGELEARPERVALTPFELTIHSRGRSQMLKGSFAVDLGATNKATGEVTARWVDVDALLSDPETKIEPDPAGRLERLADLALQQVDRFDAAEFDIQIDQASLGGDLVTDVALGLASEGQQLAIRSVTARLPGDTELSAKGVIAERDFQPAFRGSFSLTGERLATFTRWALGDRGLAGKATAGKFSLVADAELSPQTIALKAIEGEISGTEFGGNLRYEGGEKRILDLALSSERLDLREVVGERGIAELWSEPPPATDPNQGATEIEPEKPFWRALSALEDATVHIDLGVDELLLPELPAGALHARLDYAEDRLSIDSLKFGSPGALSLRGEGELTDLSARPEGRIGLEIKGEEPNSLRALAETIGIGGDTISGLAPVDLQVLLAAERDDKLSLGSVEVTGTVKEAQVVLRGSARGDLSEIAAADVDLEARITGIASETLISLAAPELSPQEVESRLGSQAGATNTLALDLQGVPQDDLDLSVGLDGPLNAEFEGEGAWAEETLILKGQLSASTENAGMVLALAGVAVPPSARELAVDLRGELAKEKGAINLSSLNGRIGDETVALGARILTDKPKIELHLHATAETVSLPALFGPLIAWERTATTEELLGAVTQGKADIWPARGFALAPLDWANTQLNVTAKTMYLSSAFPLADAQFKARATDGTLDIENLEGKLFGGRFTAAGALAPRGDGAHLDVEAELSGADMRETSQALLGEVQAESAYDLDLRLTGEGLSPPGLVAGLGGEGRLTLGAGEIRGLDAQAYAAMLSQAVKTDQNRVNEKEIIALADRLEEEITQGAYVFEETAFDFEVKSGTLRLKNGPLANDRAVTEVTTLIALPSLRLDSEWTMALKDPPVEDAPPVTLVIAGPLEQIDDLSPRIDTDALVGHFTVRRMEQDVERLEQLDVSGQGPPEPEAPPAPDPNSSVETGERDAPVDEPAAAPEEPATAETEADDPAPPPRPPTSVEDLLERDEPSTSEVEPPASGVGQGVEEPAAQPAPQAQPATPSRAPRPEPAPDDWKRGLPIFGYGP